MLKLLQCVQRDATWQNICNERNRDTADMAFQGLNSVEEKKGRVWL